MDVLCEEDAPLFLRVLEGLRLLEDDTLGGGGSRGSGRVSFAGLRLVWRGKNYYATGAAEKEIGAGRHSGRHSDRRQRIGLRFPARGVMNPGLVVKLRPTGPWRIGPDSGARNRVDVIYHSDSLYSAVTSRHGAAGVARRVAGRHRAQRLARRCASARVFRFWRRWASSFRRARVWPPSSPALLAARVRWKSARFVPLVMVQSLSGRTNAG